MSVKEDGTHTSISTQKALFQNIKRFMQFGMNTHKHEKQENVLDMVLLTDKGSGITYAFRAQYTTGSTKKEPVVTVLSNFKEEHKTYEVSIRSINPQSASILEMFCLCCYLVDMTKAEQRAADVFQDLKSILEFNENMEIREDNSFAEELEVRDALPNQEMEQRVSICAFEDRLLKKRNWDKMVNDTKDLFLEAGKYYSYQCCLRLMEIFDEWFLWQHPELQDENGEMEPEVAKTLESWEKKAKDSSSVREAVKELMKQEMKNL